GAALRLGLWCLAFLAPFGRLVFLRHSFRQLIHIAPQRPPGGAFVIGQASLAGILLGGFPLRPFLAPPGGLVRLVGRFVEPYQPLQRFAQADFGVRRGDLVLAFFHAFVTLHEQRLGVGVLLLAQERFAQQRLGVEGRPVIGLLGLAHLEAV